METINCLINATHRKMQGRRMHFFIYIILKSSSTYDIRCGNIVYIRELIIELITIALLEYKWEQSERPLNLDLKVIDETVLNNRTSLLCSKWPRKCPFNTLQMSPYFNPIVLLLSLFLYEILCLLRYIVNPEIPLIAFVNWYQLI